MDLQAVRQGQIKTDDGNVPSLGILKDRALLIHMDTWHINDLCFEQSLADPDDPKTRRDQIFVDDLLGVDLIGDGVAGNTGNGTKIS